MYTKITKRIMLDKYDLLTLSKGDILNNNDLGIEIQCEDGFDYKV